MIAPRTLRTWLRRLNVVLLIVVLVLAIHAATWCPTAYAPLPEQPSFDGAQPWRPAGDADVDFDQFLAYLRVFHPEPPPERAAAAKPSGPTRIPLRAYRVAMFIQQPGEEPCLVLKSKDPSHGRTYFLARGESHRDVRILWLRYDGALGQARIERGEEVHTFRFHTNHPVRAGGITVADDPRPRVLAENPARTPLHQAHPSPQFRDMKGVPFYGSGGKVVGLRVSGVRPGSHFARLGLKAGDVVTQAEAHSTGDVEAFRSRLGEGWLPKTLTVLRDVARGGSTLTLRDS